MNRFITAGILSLTFLSAMNQAEACTAFQLRSQDNAKVYCRSMEFGLALDSHLLIVPRQTEFTGTAPNNQTGMKWKAKYGHVGMNQSMDRRLVSDGMNEKGFVVGALYLPGYAQYEKADNTLNNKTIGSWELVSYLLGTCASVEEAKAALSNLIVAQQPFPPLNFVFPLHFYLTDSSGATLIVEYIKGKRMEHNSSFQVLTNSPPFEWQQINLSNYVNLSPINVSKLDLTKTDIQSFGQGSGLLGLPGDYTPPSRFVRAALYSQWAVPGKTGEDAVKLGFHILNTFDIFDGIIREDSSKADAQPQKGFVKTSDITEWVIIHDRSNLKTYFRGYDSLNIQMADLKKIDFSQPGLREILINKNFVLDDSTNKTQPLGNSNLRPIAESYNQDIF